MLARLSDGCAELRSKPAPISPSRWDLGSNGGGCAELNPRRAHPAGAFGARRPTAFSRRRARGSAGVQPPWPTRLSSGEGPSNAARRLQTRLTAAIMVSGQQIRNHRQATLLRRNQLFPGGTQFARPGSAPLPGRRFHQDRRAGADRPFQAAAAIAAREVGAQIRSTMERTPLDRCGVKCADRPRLLNSSCASVARILLAV